jgi:hypothetical protein
VILGLARRDRNGSLNDGQIQNPSNPFGIVPLYNFLSEGCWICPSFNSHSLSRSAKPSSLDSQLLHRSAEARGLASGAGLPAGLGKAPPRVQETFDTAFEGHVKQAYDSAAEELELRAEVCASASLSPGKGL